MFVNSTLRSEIKIIDFGLSKKYSNDKTPLTEGVGTVGLRRKGFVSCQKFNQ